MKKILTIENAIEVSKKLRQKNKRIVLAGGCFDILHIGHIVFLEKAKAQGDSLFVLLESDKAIQKNKGEGRPINSQSDRAKVLQSLTRVDYILPLLKPLSDAEYDLLILSLKPDIIATTKSDPFRSHKERQAELSGARVVDVTEFIKKQSTTKIAELLQKDF